MQLTTKGRYAVMAMADLAKHGKNQVVSLAEIARRQDISLSYLEQLFTRLRRRGLVISVRGPGGGYRLALSPEETKVLAIIQAVDEPLGTTRCLGEKGCMPGGLRCLTHDLWEGLSQQIEAYFSSKTLSDVIGVPVTTAATKTSPADFQFAAV